MPEPAVVADGLHRTFTAGRGRRRRTIHAVTDLTVDVDRGERVAFVGPNGAGKSTSIKMLTGILRPTAGTARVLGLVPWEQRRRLSTAIGVLFGQRSQLWDELPPRASLRVLGAVFGLDETTIDRRLAELGELLEAAELLDQPMRTLSLGQRMRCELAACLLHEPSLLFLDEPTIGLDLLAKQRFRRLLVDLNHTVGTTVFLTSHDVVDVELIAQRVIVVDHGTVVYDGSVSSLRRDLLATKRVDVLLARPVDRRALDRALRSGPAGIAIVEVTGTRVRLDVDLAAGPFGDALGGALGGLLRHLPVTDLSVVDPPLEQALAHVMGAGDERSR